MKYAFGLLALLTLAACARAPANPQAAAEQACAREADDDPEVHQMAIIAAGSTGYAAEHASEIRQRRAKAVLACLQKRGLAPKRGGVEAPVNPDGGYLF
jgi:hypothetical protein